MTATLPIERRPLARFELAVPRVALGPGRPEHLAPVQEALERPLSPARREEVGLC